MDLEHIASTITTRRAELRWTWAHISRKADLDPVTVWKARTGRPISSTSLRKLDRALGFPTGTLEGAARPPAADAPLELVLAALDDVQRLLADLVVEVRRHAAPGPAAAGDPAS